MRLRNALLAASVLAAPVAAMAAPVEGIYIGGGAGGNYLEDYKIKSLTVTGIPGSQSTTGSTNLRTNWGGVGLISLGYGFGNGLRAEIEGNYRQNSIRKFNGTTFPTSAGGDVQQYGGMVNVLYDFDFASMGLGGMSYLPTPYVGVGVGYGETRLNGFRAFAPGFAVRGLNNPSDGNLAYQAIGGVAFPLDDLVPGLALTAEYRYYGTSSGNQYAYATQQGGSGFPFAATTGKIKVDNASNHSILLGIRYNFGVAPPPPPPAVAPAPQAVTKSYLVFFDWDRADLTTRARQIISEAAQNSTKVQYTKIDVNGYTDTSGTPAYNQRLSVRRAQTVAAELVRDGVPRQAIAIRGFGETNLLVPTANGVREPQNRRVEIIIR